MTEIIWLKYAIYILGLTSNPLSSRAMAAGRFELHIKGEYIIVCGGWLRFPVVDGLHSLYGFPIIKRMFETMPYIRDAPNNDARDAENVWIRDDVPNKAEDIYIYISSRSSPTVEYQR